VAEKFVGFFSEWVASGLASLRFSSIMCFGMGKSSSFGSFIFPRSCFIGKVFLNHKAFK